jgi:Fe-S oxidoreductase
LVNYLKEKRIAIDPLKNSTLAVYHDPCNYGRKAKRLFGHGYYEEPRWVMDQCFAEWKDLWPNKKHQFCCGGGGGTMVTGYDEERLHYGRKKISQIKYSGAGIVVVPCHSCHGQIGNLLKEAKMNDIQVKYLWEVVADSLVMN